MVELPAGTEVVRIFYAGGEHPTQWNAFRYFGPTGSRFDHQQADSQVQNRGVMYLAAGDQATPTCLAEVFQVTRVIDRFSRDPVLAGFQLAEPLRLLNLRGPFCTAIGASTAIHSGPRPRARRWAQQLYEAYPKADGLYYASSMYANQPAIALFERAARAMPRRPVFHRQLKDPVLAHVLTQTGQQIRYQVV